MGWLVWLVVLMLLFLIVLVRLLTKLLFHVLHLSVLQFDPIHRVVAADFFPEVYATGLGVEFTEAFAALVGLISITVFVAFVWWQDTGLDLVLLLIEVVLDL